MTPVPPASPEGGDLPPRHRPSLGNLAKDTTESDLWAFDDLDPDEPMTVRPSAAATPLIPQPRDLEKTRSRAPIPPAPGNQDPVSVHVNKPRPKTQPGLLTGQSKPGREFDDLDHWDEAEPAPRPAAVPVPMPAAEKTTAPLSIPEMPAEPAKPAPPKSNDSDEFTPPAVATGQPHSLRPRWVLSKVEKIGLAFLGFLLLAGGIAIYSNTVSRLPTGDDRVKANDFPIRGKYATVDSAVSYWRTPAASDAVRRGTQLIPEVILKTSGGPGAIRVFFRNADNQVVGDPVTRRAQAGAEIRIAATAGFDDVGMHAAYRTDKTHPWTIEVHEAPTEDSSGPEFLKFFEMNISPDRH